MLAFFLLAALAQAPAAPGPVGPETAPLTPAPVVLPPATHELFSRIQGRVGQVRIIERRAGTKSSIGSAFLVSATGHAITNYHVISDLVMRPEDYSAELVRDGHPAAAVRLLAVDVVHDLAVIQVDEEVKDFFALEEKRPPHGVRLYAMGNPHDLGTTIVEGTYNGLIPDALYERLNFTGSINPGMSGGPTLTAEGRVVGVNVATMGNQLGFLVPVEHARALLARAIASGASAPDALLTSVRTQLLEHQQRLAQQLLAEPLPRQAFGAYQVPGRWRSFLKCWGDTPHDTEAPYTLTSHQCSSEEDIFLSSTHRTGEVSYSHEYATTSKLGAMRFSSLRSALFAQDPPPADATREDVTNFRCETSFVDVQGLTVRAALCLRAYKRFPGLYDLVLRGATLDSSSHGLETTLMLAGFSSENARALARRYLEGFSWTK
ncbi:serine protease [Myxococcaceae bacterium GXIMD 01537]